MWTTQLNSIRYADVLLQDEKTYGKLKFAWTFSFFMYINFVEYVVFFIIQIFGAMLMSFVSFLIDL